MKVRIIKKNKINNNSITINEPYLSQCTAKLSIFIKLELLIYRKGYAINK